MIYNQSTERFVFETLINVQKQELRTLWRQNRRKIPLIRRQEAAQNLALMFHAHPSVLSYASFDDELDTWQLNRQLAKSGQLFLPKLINQRIIPFKVEDLDSQLSQNRSKIWEPIPELCQQADLEKFDLILVPGLAFDSNRHRLGYGKGHYDYFLASFTKGVKTCGVGFQEQRTIDLLPTLAHDIPLGEVLFF